MKVRVVAKVHPTENTGKVRSAVENIFDMEMRAQDDILVGEGEDLDKLHELLRRFMVLDAARRILLRNMMGNRTSFKLNKQAAYMGKVNFSAASPLGSIDVTIEDDDIQGVIDRLSPETMEGREID